MIEPSVFYTVVFLMFLSITMNSFGIYCLKKQRKGNRKQRLLLQNLSVIEITKMLFDYVSISMFHFRSDWFEAYCQYFEIFEANIMCVYLCSTLLISLDRLACVLLRVRYNYYITERLIQEILFTVWIVGLTPGLFIWALSFHSEYMKVYFYIVFDVVITIMISVTYLVILQLLRNRNRRFPDLIRLEYRRNVKMLIVPTCIITTFVFFNLFPDVVFCFFHNAVTFQINVLLWTTGFVVDPIIYIFLTKKSRQIARSSLRRWFCCRARDSRLSSGRSNFDTLSVRYRTPRGSIVSMYSLPTPSFFKTS